METITVKKSDLLQKLEENRKTHRSTFEKALEGYRALAIEELEKMLAEARQNKRVRRSISLIEPIDQTREYDRAIAMLQMSVDDTIKLSAHEFSQYCLDEWQWSHQFNMTNSAYING